MKLIYIIGLIFLVCLQTSAKIPKSHALNHNHVQPFSLVDETQQPTQDSAEQDAKTLKTINYLKLQYRQYCLSEVYVQRQVTASDISTQSLFSVFTEDEQTNIIQLIFKQDYKSIKDYYLVKFLNSVLLWISFFTVTIIGWGCCCVNILFIRRENKGVSNTIKTVLTILFVLVAFLTLYLSTGGIASDSEDQKDLMKQADCDFLAGSLTIIDNQLQNSNWGGLLDLNDKLTNLKTFISSMSTQQQFSTLGYTVASLQTSYSSLTTTLNTFPQQASKTLPNPDPLVTTPVNSQFLQSLTGQKSTINTDISPANTHITELNSISSGLNQINTPNVIAYLQKLHNDIDSGLKLMVEWTSLLHSILATQGSKVQDQFFTGLEYFFYFNIVTLITGLLGFFGLSITKNQHFGKCLHFTWFFGTCNLVLGIICAIVFFYAGVLIQDGYCNPMNVMISNQQKAAIQFKKIFDAQPLLQQTLDQCVYSQNGDLSSVILQQQLTSFKTVQQQVTDFLTIQPISTSNINTLKTNCLAVIASYDQAISTSSNVADNSATTLTQWSNHATASSLQTNPTQGGGALCQKSQDQYVWKSSSCGATTQYNPAQPVSQNFGQPTCIVFSTGLSQNLASQRYTQALFTGCRQLDSTQSPFTNSVDASIIKYYNALYQYVTATGAVFTPLCASITNLQTTSDSLSQSLVNLKPLVQSVQTNILSQITDLEDQLSCSWLPSVLEREKSVICQVIFDGIADNYFNYAKSCYVLAVYLIIIAYATVMLFSRPLISNVQGYDKNLNQTGTSFNIQSQQRNNESQSKN